MKRMKQWVFMANLKLSQWFNKITTASPFAELIALFSKL